MTVNQVINVAALDPALTSLCACDVVHETHLREHVLANLRLIVAKHGYLRTYYRMLFDGFLQLNNEVVTVKGKDGQPDTKMRTNLLRWGNDSGTCYICSWSCTTMCSPTRKCAQTCSGGGMMVQPAIFCTWISHGWAARHRNAHQRAQVCNGWCI